MLKYTIFFPKLKNIDLVKESGMIAHYLSSEYGYDVKLTCFQNDDYLYKNQMDPKVQLTFIKNVTGIKSIDSLLALVREAKIINILQLYHLS